MSHILYISIVLFITVVLQVLAGNTGLILPLLPLVIFYVTIAFGWEEGIISAAISGIIFDLLYGRIYFISPVAGIVAVLLAMLWLHKGKLEVLTFQMIPSGIIGGIYILPFAYYSYQRTEHSFILALGSIGIILISSVVSAAIFPIIIKFFDSINVQLGFKLYRTSQEKIKKNNGN